jgi:hypothetical protein
MSFDSVWERVVKTTGWKTQTDLATFLGITQASVAGAKKRGLFPIEWAYKIAQAYGTSTDWLLSGKGGDRGLSMVASGNGNIQAGGGISGKIVQVRDNSEPVWIKADHPLKDDIEEIFRLLKIYGSPKVVQEFKEKLLRIKAAVEEE